MASIYERVMGASYARLAPAADGRLVMQLRDLRFLGIPCPAFPRPRVVAEEADERGTDGCERLHFRVEARVPGVGQVVGYRGHLVLPPDAGEAASRRG